MRLHLVRVFALAVVSLGLAACGGDGGGHKRPSVPASITIVSGNSQTGVAGSALPAALNVSVKDSSGRAVAGASVSWAVIAGGGSVTPTTSTTDSAGVATTNWTLGAALGANRATATVGTLPAVGFDATGVAGPAASVSIVSGNGQGGAVGTELPAALTVRVTDSGARPVAGVTVTWAVTAGGGTVTPASSVTDSGGAANTRWTLGATAGANRATATVAGLPGVTFDATGSAAGPMVRAYEDSEFLYLESRMGVDVARIGLRKSWGGAITEASLNGVDYVNDDNPGRQIQVSLWDGNAKYDEAAGFWQWNPVEAGDHFYHGSPLLEARLAAESIYTRTQPIHWAPENISSVIGPLLGDAYIEKWVSVVPGHHRAFKVHYRITHFGTDAHANMLQELPVMYVNPNVPNIVYYAGLPIQLGAGLGSRVRQFHPRRRRGRDACHDLRIAR